MRIVVDARYLAAEISGIGNYSRQLLEHLALIDDKNEYHILTHASFRDQLRLNPRMRLIPLESRPLSLATLATVGGTVRRLRPDLFHALCPVTPPMYRGAMVVTVHDLQPIAMPEWSGGRPWPVPWLYRHFYSWIYPSSFARAARLITVSDATRRSLVERYPEWADKTVALPSGFTSDPIPADADSKWEKLRRQHGLPKRYMIYIGSTRPNKNLERMIEAFAQLLREDKSLDDLGFVLVLTPDRFLDSIKKTIETSGVRESVRILTGMDRESGNVLLRGARLLFFVTRFEGFGFPILEAQSLKVPVLVSNADASPEIAGDGGLLVDWANVAQQRQALTRLLSDETLRRDLIEKGERNLERFRWERTARSTLEQYCQIAAQ